MRRFFAALTALSIALAGVPVIADAEGNDTAAVSGYVSLTASCGSLELAGENKTPVIHVDGDDYEGVLLAAENLQGDIKAVTGKTPEVTNDDITVQLEGSSGISVSDNTMTVTFDYPVAGGADCYAAVYDRNGILTGVKKSTEGLNKLEDGSVLGFGFDGALKKPAGGSIKAFLWRDMEPLTSVQGMLADKAADLSGVDVVIGTLGKSETVDALALSGKIDVSEIEGRWESFTIQEVDDTIVIAGSDKRGTIYGIYDLSEKIGVSPWYFWADTIIGHADSLYISLPDGGYTEGEPSVKYRGIFLNDEFNLSEWSKSMGNTGKNMNNETYEKLFELLLRLKANYLWPAMHTYSTAFNNTENNAALADKYGIVMGSSHCEPLLRNNLGELYNYQQEWTAAHPDKTLYINTTDDAKNNVSWMWTDKDADGNAVDNKEFLTDYWRSRVQANGGYENTYTIGMRGVHDGKFSTNMDSKTAMAEIIAAQRSVLEEELCADDREISDIPQVFIPYKEILDLYNGGLSVPDDVTLMWPDDNFGYIRQLPTEAERERSGGAGIYYHLSYYGRPMSYLWLGTTQPGLIREEMTKAYDMGAQRIWIANVGDLKPAETEIEYFLDLAKDVEGVRSEDIGEHLAANAKRDFGLDDTQAAEYADIKLKYYELANSRRPEHMSAELFSLTDYGDEGQKLLDGYAELEARAEVLYNGLSAEKKPSFYELMLYPLRGAGAMAQKYVYSDKAKLYSESNCGAAVNKYSALSDAAYQRIIDDTAEYTSMLGGKWDKMMNPYQTQLRGSTFGGTITGKLDNPTVSELPYSNLGIYVEGGRTSLRFTQYSTETKFIDIINTGTGAIRWEIDEESLEPWLKINKMSGTVADNDRIYMNLDLSQAPENSIDGCYIKLKWYIGDTEVGVKSVKVTLDTQTAVSEEKTYVEDDGYVSVEAEHYTNSVKNGDYEWRVEKDFGRSGDSVKIYPNTAKTVSNPNKENSAYLEYNVYFTSEGTFPIDVYRMPTINELSGSAMRCRIGIDDATPVLFSGNTKTSDNSTGTDAWGKGVMQNTEVLSGSITVPSKGLHTVRLYNESPGVVIDKFVISTGGRKASYFGAPESYNTTYNNTVKPLPEAKEAASEQTGDITALFEPSMYIAGTTAGETTVSAAKIIRLDGKYDKGVLVAAAYDSDGNMLDASYTPVDLSDIAVNGEKTLDYADVSTENAAEKHLMLVTDTSLDDENSFEPIAPALKKKIYDVPDEPSYEELVSSYASYDEGYVYPAANTNEYIGKESVCVISENGASDTAGIKYIRQNTVAENTYNKIPFTGEGKYDLKIKVAGESGIISERFSTIKNIATDTEPTSTELYSWDFETDQTGTGEGVPVLGGNAVYDETNKCVKLTPTAEAGGSLTVDLGEAVTAAQGEKITIVSKIAYGDLPGKYMTYELTDSSGNMLVRSKINRYTGKTQSLTIGGVEQLTDGNYPSALLKIDKSATSPAGRFSVYTVTIDPASNEITVVVSNIANSTVNEYSGKLPDGTSYDLKKLYFTTDYDNASRTCYVDDISITKSRAASYTINFTTLDSGGNDVSASANITVTDAVTGAVIAPEADGTYKLCDGVYNYISAVGGTSADGVLELSPATESKTVTVNLP